MRPTTVVHDEYLHLDCDRVGLKWSEAEVLTVLIDYNKEIILEAEHWYDFWHGIIQEMVSCGSLKQEAVRDTPRVSISPAVSLKMSVGAPVYEIIFTFRSFLDTAKVSHVTELDYFSYYVMLLYITLKCSNDKTEICVS